MGSHCGVFLLHISTAFEEFWSLSPEGAEALIDLWEQVKPANVVHMMAETVHVADNHIKRSNHLKIRPGAVRICDPVLP
jgi:hypothetical protein